jgi:hypothetical protein
VTSKLGLLARPIVAECEAADELNGARHHRHPRQPALLPARRGPGAGVVAGWDNGFGEDLRRRYARPAGAGSSTSSPTSTSPSGAGAWGSCSRATACSGRACCV